jgi:arylsulfatase A-like enzyme
MMGYQTPNIDRIANEGALFTCWYGSKAVPLVGRPLSLANRQSGRD